MKFFIGLLIAILTTGIASAQHNYSPVGHVNIGIKGGLNVYEVHDDDNNQFDPRVGYNFGLLGHIHAANHFAIQPEIVYSAQGEKYIVGTETTNYNLDYINVPILFQYMFNKGFRIHAGPQVGFLVSAKSENSTGTVDNKNDIEPIDFALSLGVSYVHTPTGFGFDARYNLGLRNINKNSTVKSTNRGFQVGLFYIFGYR